MDERTLWRFKTCAITITSPNQQGREGADSEEVWILTGKSVILLNRSSLNLGNGSLFPFKEAYFYACSLPARTSLRIPWDPQAQRRCGNQEPGTGSRLFLHTADDGSENLFILGKRELVIAQRHVQFSGQDIGPHHGQRRPLPREQCWTIAGIS